MKREEYEELQPRIDKYRALQGQLNALSEIVENVETGFLIVRPDNVVCRGKYVDGFLREVASLTVDQDVVTELRQYAREPLLQKMNDLETEMEEL